MLNEHKICQKTQLAVESYVTSIVAVASSFGVLKDSADVDYTPCINKEQTVQADSATITSEFGIVIVFPDFIRKSAGAAILKVGVINSMQQEGFDEEFIENEGEIYGDLLPFTKENAELFGYYLTHKLQNKS